MATLTPDEQLLILNTPEWLTNFREKINTVMTELQSLGASTPYIDFEVEGVPARVTPGTVSARAELGDNGRGGYQYTIVAPAGWFQPDDAPTVPANLAVDASTPGELVLTWDASTDFGGVAGYHVFRDGAQVADVPTPGYTDQGLTTGDTHAYAVSAYDKAANESAQCAPVSGTVG